MKNKNRPLFWRVFPPFVAIALCATVAAAWYASQAVRGFHYKRTEDRLRAAANMVVEFLARSGAPLDSPQANATCNALGKASGYRITVIMPSGRVVADSQEDPLHMDNHGSRPEVREAMRTGAGCSRRFSDTLELNMMYLAVALRSNEETRAVVRMALSLADVDGTVNRLRTRIVSAGLLLAVASTLLGLMVSRRINHTVDRIRGGVEALAAGDLTVRLPPSDISEMNLLAKTMNGMAEQLQARLGDITRQRDEQGSLFACMTESVVAVDTQNRIIKMNAAAEALFGVDSKTCSGRNVVEVIRNAELHDVFTDALAGSEPIEGNVDLFDRDIHLQARGTSLCGPSGNKIGAVVVLSDVTRLHRKETVSRESATNESH